MSLRPEIPLQSGETVVVDIWRPVSATVLPLIFTLGLYEIVRRTFRFVVTDRRVIVLRGLPGGRRVATLPLDRVQDVAVRQNFWLGDVTISTAGGLSGNVFCPWLNVKQARLIAETVGDLSRRSAAI